MTQVQPSAKSEPIGLTVYDLPSPVQVAMEDEARTRTGRIRMLLVFAICAAPIFFSYLTYYVIRPQGSASYGELIEPQRDLPSIVAKDLNGQPVQLQSLREQWLFIAVSGGKCEDACEKLLYIQRQLHKSLGKQQDKLERLWLISDSAPVDTALVQALQGATVLRVDSKELSQWLYSSSGGQLSDHLYLVDPMGRWMMRFPSHAEVGDAPTKIKRDLERLLRAANSWDQPGR
jgi:hypothetical protein